MVPKDETIPQVFLSHASEDKDRFARKLAEEFHKNGIRCWFDEWEMGPGDSLFEMINKGIHESDYFVVVISNNSISKPWVQHELAAAYSKLLQNKVLLIPIILDDLSIDSLPPLLADTFHCNFSDSSRFDGEFAKILNKIRGVSNKPEVLQTKLSETINLFPVNLSSFDMMIFNNACALALSTGNLCIDPSSLLLQIDSSNDPQDIADTLEYLAERNLIEFFSLTGIDLPPFVINQNAFYNYISEEYPGFDSHFRLICSMICGLGVGVTNVEISDEMQIPKIIVSTIFNQLKTHGYIIVNEFIGDIQSVISVSQKLKRELKNW